MPFWPHVAKNNFVRRLNFGGRCFLVVLPSLLGRVRMCKSGRIKWFYTFCTSLGNAESEVAQQCEREYQQSCVDRNH
eukprot:1444955-Amphidinium_carterae.1